MRLTQSEFSKIKIKCTAHSEGENLVCTTKQIDGNTFTIRIKRKRCNNDEWSSIEQLNPSKRSKVPDLTIKTEGVLTMTRLRPRRTVIVDEMKTNRGTKALSTVRPTSKPMPCKDIQIGKIILFKMRGFSEWPARCIEIKNKVIKVEFFGDHTTQKTSKKSCLFEFHDSYAYILYLLQTKKTPLFAKAVREAEFELGIPDTVSILNRVTT